MSQRIRPVAMEIVRPRRRRRMGRAILAAGLLAALVPFASADEDSAVVYVHAIPPPVAAVARCDETGPATTSRRTFSGSVIFAVECRALRLNFRHEVVVSDAISGEGARLLGFPKPHPPNADDPEDILYNMDFLDNGEIAELFVDPGAAGVACRHLARWRLRGETPVAELTSWRETDDCSGEAGWTVLVGPGA